MCVCVCVYIFFSIFHHCFFSFLKASGIPENTPTWLKVHDIGRTFTKFNNDTITEEEENSSSTSSVFLYEQQQQEQLVTDEIIVKDLNVLNGWGIGAELLFPSYTMEWYQS